MVRERCSFWVPVILAMLVLVSCTSVPTLTTELPTAMISTTEAPTAESPEALVLKCGEPFSVQVSDEHKPPLNFEGLPTPTEPLPINKQRVIGFAFSDGQVALVAAPVAAECTFTDAAWGMAVGVIWIYSGPDNSGITNSYVVSINTETGQGFLIDLGLATAQNIDFVSENVKAQGEASPVGAFPIDVTIRADSVCFLLTAREMRYCSQAAGQLSVKDLLWDKYHNTLAQEITDAQNLLLAQKILTESDQVLADRAISEIEDPTRIESCQLGEPGTCLADIIVAPIEITHTSPLNLGVLVVKQDVTLPGGTSLAVGQYVVWAEVDESGNVQTDEEGLLIVALNGVTLSGELVESQRIPAVLAPYVGGANDQGLMEISGCKLLGICLFWECR